MPARQFPGSGALVHSRAPIAMPGDATALQETGLRLPVRVDLHGGALMADMAGSASPTQA